MKHISSMCDTCSKLDYCNFLYYSLLNFSIHVHQLQLDQNSQTRVGIPSTLRYQHIFPLSAHKIALDTRSSDLNQNCFTTYRLYHFVSSNNHIFMNSFLLQYSIIWSLFIIKNK